MDAKLKELIADYQAAVAIRFAQLRAELRFDAPKSNTDWVCRDIPQKGRLSDGAQYFKHGYGCAIKGVSDYVDFDFGANGEIDGFDASRLWSFTVGAKKKYGFASEKEIDVVIKNAANDGALRYSGYILYYRNETPG